MFSKAFNLRCLTLSLIVALTFAMSIPTGVLADDETPPDTGTGTTSDLPLVDESASDTGAISDPLVVGEPISDTGAGTTSDLPVVDEPASDAVTTSDPLAAVEPIPDAGVEELSEVVESLNDSGAVLLDQEGSVVPLASQMAAEILTDSDPYIIRGGTTYRFMPGGGCGALANCVESATPIQDAIDFSVSGETIFIDPGVYEEQLNISKDITLQSTGAGVIIQSPALLTDFFTSGANKNYPIIYVHDTENASLIGLTIDGAGLGNANYRFDGIGFFNAGGLIQGNTIQNVMNTPFSGTQHGVGIYVYANDADPHDIVIDGNVIEDYQKNGMTISGNGQTTATITDNTVTGAGPVPLGGPAQNGIQVSNADALIQGNTVTGNHYIPDTYTSTGILFFGPGDVQISGNTLDGNDVNAYVTGAGNVEITDNTILNGEWDGAWVDTSGPTTIAGNTFAGNAEGVGLMGMNDMSTVDIVGNVFTGNGIAVANYDQVVVDATGNYWGCTMGPDDPNCDQVTSFVLYDPSLPSNPLIVPPGGGGGNSGEGTDRHLIVPAASQLPCDPPTFTHTLSGDLRLVLSNLCEYSVNADNVTGANLPDKLPDGAKFVSGLAFTLLKAGESVAAIPENATATLSFPLPPNVETQTLSVLFWDPATGSWVEKEDAKVINGRLELDADFPGIYVLISR